MTDIIEQLRDYANWTEHVSEEAAAEIERLRLTPKEAYLQIVEGWLREWRGIHFPEGAIDDLCKRIARAGTRDDD